MSTQTPEPSTRPGSVFGPLLLIGIGLVFLFNNLGILPGNAWDLLLRLWPLLLVMGGLDSLYKREGITGPVFAIGIGLVFLAANFGYLDIDVWGLILRLWPVLIIAAGFDLLLGRRSVWLSLAGVVVTLGILAGTLWLSGVQVTRRSLVDGQAINQPLQGASDARLTIDPGAGGMRLRAGETAGTLISGMVQKTSGRNIREELSLQGSTAIYTLHQTGTFNVSGMEVQDWDWDLSLARDIPLDLTAQMGAGRARVDLTNLEISRLNLDLGVGQMVVILPVAGDFDAAIDGGVGDIVIRVPKGTAVRIEASGLSTRTFPPGYEHNGDTASSPGYAGSDARITLRVNMGIGMIRVEEFNP